MARTSIGQGVENFLTPANCRDREATGHGFGVGGKIRLEIKVFAGAAQRDTKTGDHFVEDRDGTFLLAEFDHARQVSLAGHAGTAVDQNRLTNDRRDLARVLLKHLAKCLQIVPGASHRQRVLGCGLPAAIGDCRTELLGARVIADQDVIQPAVVMAFEFYELVPAGEASCQTQCCLYSFGAGIGEDDPLHMGDHAEHLFRKFHFAPMLCAVRVSA